MTNDDAVSRILEGLPVSAPLDQDDDGPSSWEPVDLADAIAGVRPSPPTLMARVDGVKLLYCGRVHWFQGESESLKSWGAQVTAKQVLEAGGRVLYVDFEDDAGGVVERLLALGATSEAIAERFVYLRPDEPLFSANGDVLPGALAFEAVLDDAGPFDLAVIDGVTEAMTTEGLELNSNSDAARWMRRVPKRIARVTGAAVVVIDHVTKSSEGRGRYAIGAQHKLSGVDGATYGFVVARPLARATSEPIEAAVTITVQKDRVGHVRGHAVGGKIATLEITAYPDGGVTAALVAPSGEPSPDLHLVGTILDYLGTYDGSSKNAIETSVTGNAAEIRSALKWLADDTRSWVRVEVKGQSHRHWLTDAGRQELEGFTP